MTSRYTFRKLALRIGAITVVGAAIVGPTPGYVGNCNGTTAPVDRVQFCTNKEAYSCARDLSAGRIDTNAYSVCQMHVDSTCHGFNWPDGCSPSKQLTDACIDAVSDANRVSTPTAMLTECMSSTLCGAAPLTSASSTAGEGI